jgi:outer membrane protein assembly factor BamB
MGLGVEDRAVLWDFPWTTEYDVNSSQPLLVGENRIFISAGYGHGAVVLDLTGGGVRTVWQNIRMKNKFNGSVLYEGHVYGLDEGILACVNVENGVQKWKGGRYGYGQVLLAGGHLVITSETGEVVLVKATPERHQEVARFSAIEGKTWNNPAIAGGLLLVRNATEMACFRLGRQ